MSFVENLRRRVNGYSRQSPRIKEIHPDSPILEKRTGGFPCAVTVYTCACVVKEYSGGLSTRAGCVMHKDAIRYKCPTCDLLFDTKVTWKGHRYAHAQ